MTLLTEYFLGSVIMCFLLMLALVTSKTFGVAWSEPFSKASFCIFVCCFMLLFTNTYNFTQSDKICEYSMIDTVSSFVDVSLKSLIWIKTTTIPSKSELSNVKCVLTFLGSIENDSLSFFVRLILSSFAALFFLIISDTFQEQKIAAFEFIILLLFSFLGMFLLCSASDFLVAYLALELMSLSAYILTAFKKASAYSIEAGIKYFVIGTISSALFLLGSSFIYFFTGSIEFYTANELVCAPVLLDVLWGKAKGNTGIYGTWSRRSVFYEDFFDLPVWVDLFFLISGLSNSQDFIGCESISPISTSFVEFGLALLLLSIFIKLGVAPFHFWTLDVYESAPTNTTIFFTIFPKLSIMALLTRLYYLNFQHFGDYFQLFFIWVALLSLFFGTFGGLRQRKLKTLMGYSSLTSIGYSLLAFSSRNPLGLGGSFLNISLYMFTSLAFWAAILILRIKPLFQNYLTKYSKELGNLALLRLSNPSAAICLALIMFSIAGVPPLVGFLSKSIIFLSVIERLFYVVGSVSILFSVISSFYYIRVIKTMYFESSTVGQLYFPGIGAKVLVLSILGGLLSLFFVHPTCLVSQVNNVSSLLFYKIAAVGDIGYFSEYLLDHTSPVRALMTAGKCSVSELGWLCDNRDLLTLEEKFKAANYVCELSLGSTYKTSD